MIQKFKYVYVLNLIGKSFYLRRKKFGITLRGIKKVRDYFKKNGGSCKKKGNKLICCLNKHVRTDI